MAKKWLKNFARNVAIVVSPPAAKITKIAAKQAEPLTAKAAKAIGADPDATKKILGVVGDPAPTIVELGEKIAIHAVKTTADGIKAQFQFIEAVTKGDFRQMAEAFIQIVGNQVDAVLNPAVIYVVNLATGLIPQAARNDLMEQPKLQLHKPTGVDTLGLTDPKLVYYVNGMLTSLESAATHAQTLADHLKRPVALLYNTTMDQQGDKGLRGLPKDIVEKLQDGLQAIYDRAWIATLQNTTLLPGKVVQLNRTTRQLTHLLHHSTGNLSIVTHSQGCLIMRNALVTASRFRDENEPERRVRWIAAGTPLRDEEVLALVEPNLYTPIANKNDSVSQALGLRLLNEEDRKRQHSGHDFVTAYVPQIDGARLW